MISIRQMAKRYARVFLTEQMHRDDILILAAEIQFIADSMRKNKDLKDFLENPVITRADKLKVIDSFAEKGGISTFTKSLLEVLINKNRMALLINIASELHFIADQILSRIRVRMTTAQDPVTLETESVSKKIGRFFNKNVFVEYGHNPSLIGGFVIEGDGKLVDMSIKGQLDKFIKK